MDGLKSSFVKWVMIAQEFDFTVKHVPGKQLCTAGLMPRAGARDSFEQPMCSEPWICMQAEFPNDLQLMLWGFMLTTNNRVRKVLVDWARQVTASLDTQATHHEDVMETTKL